MHHARASLLVTSWGLTTSQAFFVDDVIVAQQYQSNSQ